MSALYYVHFCFAVSIHTAGRMHSIGEPMHTARRGMIFYLLISVSVEYLLVPQRYHSGEEIPAWHRLGRVLEF